MRPRVLAAALLLGSAPAAETEEPHRLAPWVVAEPRLLPAATSVRATAVVPAEAWSGRALGTLADAFRQIPGAVMQESFGGFEPPRLSIRGSGLQSAPSSRGLALLFDQLPLGLADGSFNSAILDPRLARRVDVQRGVEGWRAAPATMGGALDLRGDAPLAAAGDRAALGLAGGSFGAWRGHLSGDDRRGPIETAAALSFTRQDGFRAHSEQERRAAQASLRGRLGAGAIVRVGAYHAHLRYDVPGPLTLAAALAAPRSVSAEVRRDQPGRTAEFSRVDAGFTHRTAEREIEIGVSLARTTDDFQQLQANGLSRSRSDDAGLCASFAPRFDLGSTPHRARASVTAAGGGREIERRVNDAGRPGARFAWDHLRPATITVQIEDAFTVAPRVAATAGLARVVAYRPIRDRIGGGPTTRFNAGETLPQAGLRWGVTRDTSVFGSVSASAEPPTYDDLLAVTGPYPGLRRRIQPLATQRAVTVELGARGRSARMAWDAAIFRAAWRNEILRLADASGAALGAVNASPTTHAGAEGSVRWLLTERGARVSLAATGVASRCSFVADRVFGRGRLAGVPPFVASAEVQAEFPRGPFLAVGADWRAGATGVDHAQRLRYGGRSLAHVRGGWRFAPYWTFFADVRNLFDHAGIASTAGILDLARNPAATAIFLPGSGRSVTAGLEWRR